ncbi:cytidine deaminase-like protein [Daldinia caldariorum]|uniref:cytidine deaminase-like protein n=1 Tax=Daldinia caldariorum TaxID=326644 RepID=UPI0020071E37|nr:cytidine deaminase-like protein [Daldinia caldariorum]KAI1467837.1 cytidine deaminase-like protein [Daldinia caldariorum]
MDTRRDTAAVSTPALFPERHPMAPAQIAAGVQAVLAVQRRAVALGKRPFAAALVGPDNDTVLLMHQSVDQVHHAESELARLAYKHYPKEFLWRCTLFSTWEPNDQLYELTGPGNKENFTMDWHTRDVLKGCPQKDIEVIGPLEEEGRTVVEESDKYWSKTRTSSGLSR